MTYFIKTFFKSSSNILNPSLQVDIDAILFFFCTLEFLKIPF
jgi:hypothetical protein